jgi:hypothetical protein
LTEPAAGDYWFVAVGEPLEQHLEPRQPGGCPGVIAAAKQVADDTELFVVDDSLAPLARSLIASFLSIGASKTATHRRFKTSHGIGE